MSFTQAACLSVGSTERPMILTPRRSNSGLIFAMYPSSVVQTGVKSFGCEKSTAQPSPIHSWNRMGPSDVCASKSGAVSPIVRANCFSLSSRCTARGPTRSAHAFWASTLECQAYDAAGSTRRTSRSSAAEDERRRRDRPGAGGVERAAAALDEARDERPEAAVLPDRVPQARDDDDAAVRHHL